jgi:ribonuclease D
MKFDNGASYLLQISRDGSYPVMSKLLKDGSILKIFHYGRFDIAAMYMRFNVLAENVFCTKIASKLARTYTDRHGLANLCREIIGIELPKDQQSSDWGCSELSEAQKRYALSDVRYLHTLKDALVSRLIRENRLNVAQAAFEFLPHRAYLDCLGYTKDIFDWGSRSD